MKRETQTRGGLQTSKGQKRSDRSAWRRRNAETLNPQLSTTPLTCQAPARKDGRVCGAGLGESMVPIRLVAVFRRWNERLVVSEPRDVRRCRKCGWYTVSELVLDNETDDP